MKKGNWNDYKGVVLAWALEADDNICPDKRICKKATIVGEPCANTGCGKAPCRALRRGDWSYGLE